MTGEEPSGGRNTTSEGPQAGRIGLRNPPCGWGAESKGREAAEEAGGCSPATPGLVDVSRIWVFMLRSLGSLIVLVLLLDPINCHRYSIAPGTHFFVFSSQQGNTSIWDINQVLQ